MTCEAQRPMSARVPSETGMYCRGCFYDLRGQETPRCPECGRAFDPGDPHSFLEYPGRFHGVWIKLKEYRGPAAALLTGAWLLCMVLGALGLEAVRRNGPSARNVTYLKMITIQRIIWQHDDPENRDFDRKAAVRDLPALPSPYTEQTKIVWGGRLAEAIRVGGNCAIPTAVYAVLMIPLVSRRRRWAALGVLALCLTLFYASLSAAGIVGFLFPAGHAYLDDYVYINGVDMTSANSKRGTTIAAYDLRSFKGDQQRIIGFADGHAETLGDDRAKPLFEAQGLEYPKRANGEIGE